MNTLFRYLLVSTLAASMALSTSASAQQSGDRTPPTGDAELRSYYAANGLLNRGLYDLAADEYRRFLEGHGDHEKANVARYGLGVCLFRLQQYDDATTTLSDLRERTGAGFEFAAEVQMLLGQCAMLRGEAEAAIGQFTDFLARHPDHDLADDAAAWLVESQYRGGEHEAAHDRADAFLAEQSESPLRERVALFGGLAYMARERYAAAQQRFAALLDEFPAGTHLEQATLLLGQCAHRAGDARTASSAYRRLIPEAQEQFLPDAMYGLALLHHEQRKFGDAGTMLDQLVARFPKHQLVDAAHLLRGRVWFDLNKYDTAIETFQKVDGTSDDQRAEAAYWIAKTRLRQGQHAEAATRLGRALQRYPKSPLRPEMLYDRAVALTQSGDRPQTIQTLQIFITDFRKHALRPGALQMLASAQHQEGNYDASAQSCSAFMESFAEHEAAPEIAFLDAENAFLSASYDAAVVAYTGFLAAYPEHDRTVAAQFRLGMSHYHLDQLDDARGHLEVIADAARTDPSLRSGLLALGDVHFRQQRWTTAATHLEAFLTPAARVPGLDDALIKLGIARVRMEQFDPAIDAFSMLIDQFAGSVHRVQALFERGQALLMLERSDDAVRDLRRVLAEESASRFAPFAHLHLGTIAVRGDDVTNAVTHFEQAVELAPDETFQSNARYELVQVLMSQRAYEPALTVLTAFLRDDQGHPRHDRAAAQRGIALARLNRHGDALGAIDTALSESAGGLDDAMRATLLYEKAWCLRSLQRSTDAASAYEALLDEPRGALTGHALLELAELHTDAEQYAEAIPLLVQLRELIDGGEVEAAGDLHEQCLYRLGACAYRLEQYDQAISALEAFLDAFAGSALTPSAALLCGESLFLTDHAQRAATHLARITEDYPEHETAGPALLRLGECHATLQQWEESEATFRTYLEQNPGSDLWFQAQFGAAWALENRGEHEQAIVDYRKVVDQHTGPTAARAQFQVGECLFALEQYDEAARELLKVDILYAYPEWSAAALYEAGRCFQALSDPVKAKTQFEQVVSGHEDTRWARMAAQQLEKMKRTTLPGRGGNE